MTSRQPPAVRFPVRRSRMLGALLAASLLAGAGGLGAWVLLSGVANASPWPAAMAGAFWCLAAAGAFHFWFSQFSGVIRWDGNAWTLEVPASGVVWALLSDPPEVFLDMQAHLWLHAFSNERGRIWLWLERSAQPERWLDLRRAVYSRARPGADNADETAPASSRGRES